jgi:hypothetical protein
MPLSRVRVASGLLGLVFVLVESARADCVDDAAAHHQVNALVLRAIGWHESRLDPAAVGHNANGSIDIGAFQINSAHLPDLARYGVSARLLADGCVSAYVAAWHYRRQMDRLGNTWGAVGAYHSRTPSRAAWYANRIAAVLMSWGVLPRTAAPSAANVTEGPGSPAAPAFQPPVAAPIRPSSTGALPRQAPGPEAALFDALPAPSPEH